MKRKVTTLAIVILAIVACAAIAFIIDSFSRRDFENPYAVGKHFSYCYMIKDTIRLKDWADKNMLFKKKPFDNIRNLETVNDDNGYYWKHLEIASACKIGNAMVCTYINNKYDTSSTFFTVALKPIGSKSLWERFQMYIYNTWLFKNMHFNYPHLYKRWLVVNFYNENEFAVDENKELFEFVHKMESETPESLAVRMLNSKTIENMEQFEASWSDAELIRQYRDTKKKYYEYWKAQTSGER